MYEGEVFTYRNDRPTRSVARPSPQRSPAPDVGRAEALAGAERVARLEATVQRLEESVTNLSGVVAQLAGALEEAEAARARAAAVAAAPRPATAPAARAPEPAVEPKVSVQMIRSEEPPAPPPAELKVSLFAGNSTEAVLGQVRVTHT